MFALFVKAILMVIREVEDDTRGVSALLFDVLLGEPAFAFPDGALFEVAAID